MQLFIAFISGLLFGFGLLVSHMSNPDKVLNFLDITGSWDPSLIFVMSGALAVAVPGFFWVRRRGRPLLEPVFHLAQKTRVDRALLLGAAVFGIGWGLSGYCPAPIVINFALFNPEAIYMLCSFAIGSWLAHRLTRPA
jgi:uncharacterized protein